MKALYDPVTTARASALTDILHVYQFWHLDQDEQKAHELQSRQRPWRYVQLQKHGVLPKW